MTAPQAAGVFIQIWKRIY